MKRPDPKGFNAKLSYLTARDGSRFQVMAAPAGDRVLQPAQFGSGGGVGAHEAVFAERASAPTVDLPATHLALDAYERSLDPP